jgi:UDP-N-acetylmuramate dehydrogenase
MNILQNVSLHKYSTMRLGGTSRYVVEIHTPQELLDALEWADDNHTPFMMVGTGSNIVWKDEGYSGLLLVNKILRYETSDETEEQCTITIGAGEIWDTVVARSVQAGLSGIEALSLIPGTAGATPIQNVGAYGQDIAQTLVSVDAYDTQAKSFVTLAAADCGFEYRTSRFKTADHGRFLITAVTLRLTKGNPKPPYYEAVERYMSEHHLEELTPETLRKLVIAIRKAKLPDPAVIANNGSFFANPIIAASAAELLLTDYPTAPNWPTSDGKVKVAAAWLVEQAGFKDYHDSKTGMATWRNQALVFVNEKANTTADLLTFRQFIIDAVKLKFGITLEQEPELLP